MRLWDCVDKIEDPRNVSGRRYRLGSIKRANLTPAYALHLGSRYNPIFNFS
jgi:hypothetical protein